MWKMIFGGRQTLVEDDLWWKTSFGGSWILVEDDPCMLPSPLCGIFSLKNFFTNIFLIHFWALDIFTLITFFEIILTMNSLAKILSDQKETQKENTSVARAAS